ncbi:MAG: hypothetical protein MK066_02120 [Crocinitomicaceae bacterium]|nr:hypothetical protein [Crocinitomicaceae bacterium]
MKNLKRLLPFICACLILIGIASYGLGSMIFSENQSKTLNTATIGLVSEKFSLKFHLRSINVESMENCVYDLKLNGTSMNLTELSENGRSFYLDNLNNNDLLHISGSITGTIDGSLTTIDVDHSFPLSKASFEVKTNVETTMLAHDLLIDGSVRIRE